MLLAALRRFFTMLVLICGGTAVVSLVFGAAAGLSVDRAVSVGFYLVGCCLLIVGFFTSTRGPTRQKGDDRQITMWRTRPVRWATRFEQEEALNVSGLLLAIGFSLVIIGAAIDSRHSLF
jgi:hypothetical protein